MPNEHIREANIERVLETAFYCFLQYGIEQTTQTQIAEKSHLTFRSVNRYFKDKTDLVVQTAGWLARYIRTQNQTVFARVHANTNGKKGKKGIALLEEIFRSLETVYLNSPSLFALKGEFDIYIFRHGITRDEGYAVLWQYFDPCKMLTRTFEIGYADGSIRQHLQPAAEARYCCNSFFCFLQQLSIFEHLTTEQAKAQIDTLITRILENYRADDT